jgi:hypothetical protein
LVVEAALVGLDATWLQALVDFAFDVDHFDACGFRPMMARDKSASQNRRSAARSARAPGRSSDPCAPAAD